MTKKTISDFLSNEYRDFSLYTIENRAIPSLIDGFKPSQRKVMTVANEIWKNGNEKPLKVFQLAGKVAADAFYHHGNSSLENAIVNMAQSFKNNMALLDEIGQFGSLRSTEAGASRYIGTKLNKNFRLLYKDFELLDYREEEGQKIEPNFFLPIVPTILINGSSGIAVGFASKVLNRNPVDIINACESVLNGEKIPEVKPYNRFFTGDYIRDVDNQKKWFIRGRFEIVNSTTVRITELPPSITYENYERVLDELVDNKVIISYEDNCKDNVDYVIKFFRETLSEMNEDKLFKILKLSESVTEIFSTLDENGNLKIFENDLEIIEYFVNFRLEYYKKRKDFIIDKMKLDLKVLGNKGRFIKNILEGKLSINNKPRESLILEISNLGIEKIEDSYDYLLRMPIWSLTLEQFDKLKEDFRKKKTEFEEFSKIEPKSMYIADLSELKKKLE